MQSQTCILVGAPGGEPCPGSGETRGESHGELEYGATKCACAASGVTTSDVPAVRIPVWKRVFDTLLIISLLPLLLPLMLLIAAYVKIASPGPVIFRQRRIGYQGRSFECLKFRTMHVDSDTAAHQAYLESMIKSGDPMTKLDSRGDKRVIRGGELLRWSGLDELPQLVNVLRGEMSWVGPRPCLPYEFSQYQPRHMGRLAALPGLTGLWQVSGKNQTTFEQMIDLDLDYISRQSPSFDVSILAKTFGVVGRGFVHVLSRPRSAAEASSDSTAWAAREPVQAGRESALTR